MPKEDMLIGDRARWLEGKSPKALLMSSGLCFRLYRTRPAFGTAVSKTASPHGPLHLWP